MIDVVVAIVGRPNVGKSSLFNRLIGERVSIVHDEPGVTRDRIYGKTNWLGKEIRLIDTGGLQIDGQAFQDEIRMQVDFAIDEADLILFVSSGVEGMTKDDEYIASLLRKTNKKVLPVINKVDNPELLANTYEFYGLGFGDPFPTSASHGIGVGDVLDWIIQNMDEKQADPYEDAIHFAVIGRPNVGKSSLVNALLKEDRVIVSDQEGTTRDAVDTPFTYDEKDYVIIDTAGIRKRGKIYEEVEKYSVIRAMSAIDRADVVLFVIDGERGLIAQDKNVAGLAHEAGKAIIIIYNKYDQVDTETENFKDIETYLRNQLQYLSHAPMLFVSAKTGRRIHAILPTVETVYDNSMRRIQTSVLNEVIHDAVMKTPPPSHKGKALKVYYASQVSVQPPTFVVFVNDPELCHFSYKRYLENALREAFDFEGTAINILMRKRGA
ncbi:MAG TPA: ribosome biogenesis GTPase Der [Erysipelothrix sp.]